MRGGLQRGGVASAAVAVVLGVLVAHCGGGELPVTILPGNPDGGVNLAGYAVKGPVSQGIVTAYKLLPDLTRGDALASATTDASGFFGLALPFYNGDVLLVLTGGSYAEEALAGGDGGVASPPVAVNVDFIGLLMGYQAGQPSVANITPVSHLAYSLARYHVNALGEPAAQAVNDAFAHLGAHFGNIPGVATDLDWLTVTPTGLGGGGGAQLTAPQRAAVVLAGLSQFAASVSTRAGISPGGQVNALSLVTTLAEDLEADGVLDGLGAGGQQLLLPAGGTLSASGTSATALDGSTVRISLASAIATFVASSNNTSSISVPDVGGLTGALASDADPYLFKSAGTTFDVSPPRLSIVSAPPAYTNQGTVSFSVAADDGPDSTGVKVVMARTGDGTELTGVNSSSNVWTFSNVATGGAVPYFDVWAVDNANNSGEQLPVGDFHLQIPCLEDDAPPSIVQDFSVTSYFDERSMQLASSALPPQFTWSGALPAAVGPGVDGAIWKSSVRLSWGAAQPTGANLESPNANNVPFIQVGIPYDATTDAPITSVTYSIAVDGGATSSGPLVPAKKAPPGTAYFYLPITQETIPSLAFAHASPITFSVSVTAVDAAGNSFTQELASPQGVTEFTFHIIGPPLYVQEDTGYPTAADPNSIYPFALADGSYPSKFAGNNGGEIARQARFVVYNPYSVTVPFTSSFPSYETTGTEEWDDSLWLVGSITWDLEDACAPGPPCEYNSPQPQPFVTTIGSTSYACEATTNPSSHANPPGTAFSSASGELSPWQPGAENVRPAGYQDRIIVPAAQGGTPGSIVAYVGRPWGSFGLPPYVFTTESNPDGVSRFYRYLQDFWQGGEIQRGGTCQCVPNPPGPPICLQSMLVQYAQRRWTNVLSAASESFSGTWAYESFAETTPTSDLGDGAPRDVSVLGSKSY